jgi:hypothetical protein
MWTPLVIICLPPEPEPPWLPPHGARAKRRLGHELHASPNTRMGSLATVEHGFEAELTPIAQCQPLVHQALRPARSKPLGTRVLAHQHVVVDVDVMGRPYSHGRPSKMLVGSPLD